MRQCCVDRSSGSQSPFSRLIALKYYDGPTEGFVECGACQTTFYFKLLDWDDGQDLRIFALREAIGASIEGIAQALGAGEPRWPNWVPTGPIQSETIFNATTLEDRAVVATADLLNGIILGWVAVAPGDIEFASINWFERLGLSRVSHYGG